MIVKFNPQGRAEWMFGRRGEVVALRRPAGLRVTSFANVLKRAGVDA